MTGRDGIASCVGMIKGVSFKLQAAEGEEVELSDVLLVNVTSPDGLVLSSRACIVTAERR